jgi:hypothetical protein
MVYTKITPLGVITTIFPEGRVACPNKAVKARDAPTPNKTTNAINKTTSNIPTVEFRAIASSSGQNKSAKTQAYNFSAAIADLFFAFLGHLTQRLCLAGEELN